MINIYFLLSFIDSISIERYLSLLVVLGIFALGDLVIILLLGSLMSPWLVLALLALASAGGLALAWRTLEATGEALERTLQNRSFSKDALPRHAAALMAAVPLVFPGILSGILGCLLIFPPVSVRMGAFLSRILGIDWQEAYEYLQMAQIK